MPWSPTSLKPLGEQLFRYDLDPWLDRRLAEEGDRVMKEMFSQEELVTPAVMWREVAAAVALEPLSLGEPLFSEVMTDIDVGRDLSLAISLPFSGHADLFDARCGAMRSARPLWGQIKDDRLVLALDCRSEHRVLAEADLMSSLALLRRHLDALAFATAQFNARLRARARAMVGERWRYHAERRQRRQAEAASSNDLNALIVGKLAATFAGMSFDPDGA